MKRERERGWFMEWAVYAYMRACVCVCETVFYLLIAVQLSLYAHMHLSSETNSKRVSLNMADVSITTSSFYNLDQITSAVSLVTYM